MAERGELIRRRKRLAAMLPLLSTDKRAVVAAKIAKLDRQLGTEKKWTRRGRFPPVRDVASAAGVDGIGGLRFGVRSPPGPRRLVSVPFYLYNVDPPAANQGTLATVVPAGPIQSLYITGAGTETVDETNPLVMATVPSDLADGTVVTTSAFTSKVVGFKLRTPIIEWAKLQVVGLSVTQRRVPFVGLSSAVATPSPVPGVVAADYIAPWSMYTSAGQAINYYINQPAYLMLSGLSVGGGASLFMQEGFIDANIYDSRIPEFAGLRAYPKLESPNRAYIEAAVQGGPGASTSFTVSLVCDIIEDDEYGDGVMGPYARRDAMRRLQPPEGATFVAD